MVSGKSSKSARNPQAGRGAQPTRGDRSSRGGRSTGAGQGSRSPRTASSGRGSRSAVSGARKSSAVRGRSTPWGMISLILVVVLFAGGLGWYLVAKANAPSYTPSERNQDPSTQIAGVQVIKYTGGNHVLPDQRVAYTHSPPFGGAHDGFWAACNGVVYPTPVRQENLVHDLEHGAVWIAYNPDTVSSEGVATLASKVQGQTYMVMAPYPGLDQPISLQSWGHQLKVSDPNDPRIDQFIQALRLNRYQYPEVGATCAALGPGQFDQDNPPPFVPTPPTSQIDGKTVVDENAAGNPAATTDQSGMGGAVPSTGGQ